MSPSSSAGRSRTLGERLRALRVPLLLGALLSAFFAPLAVPDAVLATRDMVEYHLPMRAGFAHLASAGLPQWDPFAHGGQPLLSNPNYGAFYPLTWLALLLPTAVAVNLLVLIHAALAAWGALRLARRLGAGDAAAILAAVAYACGPTYLSLLNTLNIALAMSFLPWAMELGLALLDAPQGERSRGIWFGLSAVLAAIFLLGDPADRRHDAPQLSLPSSSGSPVPRLARLPRLAGAFALALGLAAVQLVPTLARLADSPRAAGLSWQQATTWSLPWQRFAELVFPAFFGDVARPERALFFGWGIHDRDYPYLLLIAIGLPLLLLSFASWTPPRRARARELGPDHDRRHLPRPRAAQPVLSLGVELSARRRQAALPGEVPAARSDRGDLRRRARLAAPARRARPSRPPETMAGHPRPSCRRRSPPCWLSWREASPC